MVALRVKGGRKRDAASGIYGTIVATSIVAGLSETHDLAPAQALEILLVSQVVFWLGHVYAGYLARKAERATPGLSSLVSVAVYEWPMLRACLPAVLSVSLWWMGAMSENTAYWVALALGIGGLAGLGYTFGRRVGLSTPAALVTAAVDGGLGAMLVVAKVLAG